MSSWFDLITSLIRKLLNMPDPLQANLDPTLTGPQPDHNNRILICPHDTSNNSPACPVRDSFVIAMDKSQKEDAAKRAEMDIAMNAGMVDPNPFNVLASLLGMRGGFKFAEAITLLSAKIFIFSALARDFILKAAKRGDKGAALEGRAALSHADVSPDLLIEVNYTEGDIEDALALAARKTKKKENKKEIYKLTNTILTTPIPSLKEKLEEDRTDLINLTEG